MQKGHGAELFDMRIMLATLCECLHASGQLPRELFQTSLHKARFSAISRLYPGDMRVSFETAMQSQNILSLCLEYGGRPAALELFHTCKVLSSGLRLLPHFLPGIYLGFSKRLWEWHPIPGSLRLISPSTDALHLPQAQFRDTLFNCGGGFGGSLRRVTNAAFVLDKAKGQWEPLPGMLKKREGHSAVVFAAKLYVCGGLNDEFAQDCRGEESVHGSVECYDPKTGSWSQLPRMLTRRYHHSCTGFNGRLFVCGGVSPDKAGGEGRITSVESFKPTERRWTQMASMLEERACHSATSTMEKLFVFGGSIGKLEIFDGLWVKAAVDGLSNGFSHLALSACQRSLYILGRDSEAGSNLKMQKFDTVDGIWKDMPLTVQSDFGAG